VVLGRSDTRSHTVLPVEVRSALGVRSASPVHGGGSPARLWLTERWSGERLMVKELTSRDGSVDGHDLGSFVRKPQQMRAVHARLPGLSPSYAQVVGEWHGPDWAAYAMPVYPGRPVTEPLDGDDADVPAFFGTLDRVFRVLTGSGYAVVGAPAPPDHFRSTHLDRLRRRLPLLRRHLEPELFSDRVVVNGRPCRTLPGLVAALDSDERLQASLRPGRLAFPVHGDLNLGNLLVDGDAFVVLDPRGVLEPWDPVYDFAKSLFSLTVFEQALAVGLSVRRSRDGYLVAPTELRRGFAAAAAGFLPFLDQLPYAAELDRVDPGWRRRLLVSHAVHCVAEAACRLSDRTPRAFGPIRGWEACLLLARGLYLVGLMLLDDLVDNACDVEPRGHLDWAARDDN
jgi:hypothetical protein